MDSGDKFIEVGGERGGDQRWVMTISKNYWVSVCHRWTGFGHWEWETAVCQRDPRRCDIVLGDYRNGLIGKTEEEIEAWYSVHSKEKNSLETALGILREGVSNG